MIFTTTNILTPTRLVFLSKFLPTEGEREKEKYLTLNWYIHNFVKICSTVILISSNYLFVKANQTPSQGSGSLIHIPQRMK